MRSLAKELRLSKVEDAQAGYDMMKTLYDRRIYPNVDGLRNVIRLLASSSEPIRKLKVEDIIDDRIARKLGKRGALLENGIMEWWSHGVMRLKPSPIRVLQTLLALES